MNFELLSLASDDDFRAQAYSDYLAKRSEAYSKLLTYCSEAIADDTLADNATLRLLLDQEKEELCDLFVQAALAAGYDLSSMKADSLEYINLVQDLADNNASIRNYVSLHYTSPDLILDNMNAFLNDKYDTPHDDTEDSRTKFLSYSETPDLRCYSLSAKAAAQNVADKILQENDLSDQAKVNFLGGNVTIKELLCSLVEDGLNIKQDAALKLTLKDIEGVALPTLFNRSYTVTSILSEIKDSLAACTASAAAFSALKLKDVADRVIAFESEMKVRLTSAYTEASAFVSTLKQKISDTRTNVKNFIDYFMQQTGFDRVLAMAHEADYGFVDGLSPFAQATGTSPTPGLATSMMTAVAGATFKTIGLMIAGAFKAGWNAFTNWIGRIGDKIYTTYEDFYDIGELSGSADTRLIDRFEIEQTQTHRLSRGFLPHITDYGYSECLTMAKLEKEKWMKLSLIFGEVLFYISKVEEIDNDNADITVIFKLKPRPINVDLFYQIMLSDYMCMNYAKSRDSTEYIGNLNPVYQVKTLIPTGQRVEETDGWRFRLIPPDLWDDSAEGWHQCHECFKDLINQLKGAGEYYASIHQTEDELFPAYMLGQQLLRSTLALTAIENLNSDGSSVFPILFSVFYIGVLTSYWSKFQEGYAPRTSSSEYITNVDWLNLLLGKHADADDVSMIEGTSYEVKLTNVYQRYRHITYNSGITSSVGFCLWCIFFMHFYDQQVNPTDYEFFPYLSNTEGFSSPEYYLKTDAQNQAEVTAILTKVAAVIVVAALAVAIGVTVKMVKLKKMSKLRTYIGQADSAAWEGKVLSPLEMATYQRKANKLAKLQNVGTGLVGSGTTDIIGKLTDSPYMQQVVTSTTSSDTYKADTGSLPSDIEDTVSVKQCLDQLYFAATKQKFNTDTEH